MPRPATKAVLITAANGQFDKLWKLIDAMSDERKNAPFSGEMATAGKEAHWGGDKNLRDVLVHLWEWQRRFCPSRTPGKLCDFGDRKSLRWAIKKLKLHAGR